MVLIRDSIAVSELKSMAAKMFDNLVKAVVDVKRRIIVVDAELHSDEEALLLNDGSCQEDLWGINLYPEFDKNSPDFVEFDSMINIRPMQGNRNRGIVSPEIRLEILSIIKEIVQ